MSVPQDSVQIKMDRGASVSTLEVDIEIPTSVTTGMRPAA
jgi:cell division topological specificity factor